MHTPTPKPPLSEATGEFGKRVRERRRSHGLSQESLAEGTALHWSYVGQVERGQVIRTLHNILKLVEALQVDASVLVSGLHAPY